MLINPWCNIPLAWLIMQPKYCCFRSLGTRPLHTGLAPRLLLSLILQNAVTKKLFTWIKIMWWTSFLSEWKPNHIIIFMCTAFEVNPDVPGASLPATATCPKSCTLNVTNILWISLTTQSGASLSIQPYSFCCCLRSVRISALRNPFSPYLPNYRPIHISLVTRAHAVQQMKYWKGDVLS